jgi:hypothetical protein
MTSPPAQQAQPPSYSFPNDSTLGGLINQLKDYINKNTDDMLPATIVSYDRVNNVATVQPSIHMVTTDNLVVGRAALATVQVLALGGGGFVVNFPLVAGSRGWIKASDRDISLYLQSGTASAPNTQRLHSFSDGLFIPDATNGFTISEEDSANMVIQSFDGTQKISIGGNQITVAAPTINLNGETVNVNGTLVINEKLYIAHVHIDGGGEGDSGPVLNE